LGGLQLGCDKETRSGKKDERIETLNNTLLARQFPAGIFLGCFGLVQGWWREKAEISETSDERRFVDLIC
jgi:hypothetical protein